MNHRGAWLRIPSGAAAPAGSRARHTARYFLLVPIVALAALLLVTAMSSGRLQAQAQSGDATLNADADCQVPPTGLASTFGDDASGVVLTWLAPTSCTPAGYAVYRRNMSEDGSRMQQLATVGGDTLTYTDTDVEAGETYRYRVRSNDLGPRSDHTTIAVPEVEPEPAPRSDDRVVRADPMFSATLATISVPENTASGTDIGDAITATDVHGGTLTYSLTGTDASSFTYNTTTNKVQTNTTLNFEAKSSYSVTVEVRDSPPEPADDTIVVTINVTNVNEPPTITTTSMAESVAENTATTTVIATYVASDPEGDMLTWSLSGVDASDFTITRNSSSGNGELKFSSEPNYETPADGNSDNDYEVTVNVRDSADTVVDAILAVTITVTNADDPGTVTVLPDTDPLLGGSTLTASLGGDEDGPPVGAVSWSWAQGDMPDGSGTYSPISGATSNTYATIALDVGKYLRATASYTDPHGSGKSAFGVSAHQISASNSEPTFDIPNRTVAVDENSASGTNVGQPIEAMDDDNDTLTYTLSGTDSGSFIVESGGQIKTKSGETYNFESKSSYVVTLNVSDGKDAAGGADTSIDASATVMITIRNVDEPATVSIAGTESGGSTLTATLGADPDGALVGTVSWRWARGNSATGTFSNITGVLGSSDSYVAVAADVGKFLRATASYTDPHDPGKSANAVTGQIGASNAEPTFSSMSATRTLPENSGAGVNVVGGTITASDSDSGDTLTYSLTGTDAGSFEIDASGQIKTKTGVNHNFNFEGSKNSYTVTVQVHDGQDAAGNEEVTPTIDDTIAVTITLTNVNEAPTISGTTTWSVPENSPTPGTSAAFTVTDPDSTVHNWSVGGLDGDKFQISQINLAGQLRFKTTPNYEIPADVGTDNVYNVTITVIDDGNPQQSGTHMVAVTVTNVNEAPTIESGPSSFNSDENTATSTVIATYVASDVDANSNLTWSREGVDSADFTLTKNADGEGELKFASPPNFEIPADIGIDNVYNITVKVRDNHTGQLSDTREVAITVDNVNETPVISGTASPSFFEIEFDVLDADLTDMDYEIGTYSAADEELDSITWAVNGRDKDHFTINSSSGVLSFSIRPDFENPVNMDSNNVYEVVVEAMDDNSTNGSGGVKTGTYAVTVTVTNVNETPEITSTGTAYATPSFAEIEWDADPTLVVLAVQTYTAEDEEDGIVSITWSLAGDDAGDFNITTNTTTGEGVLAFRNNPNFEEPKGTPEMAGDPEDNTYEIIVKARDTTSKTRDYPVTVTVTNIDETPEITGMPPDVVDFPETPYDSDILPGVVATYTARDEEGDLITWRVSSTDFAFFVITKNAMGEGELTFSQADVPPHKRPDYERREDSLRTGGYAIVVEAHDPGGNIGSVAQVVDITDVNERPEFIGPITTAVTYDENDTSNVASYSARDEEPDTMGGVTWSLTGADAGDFVIDTGGIVTFVNTPSYESPTGSADDGTDVDGNRYLFTVVATDKQSGGSRLDVRTDVIVDVADVEEPGSITVGNPTPAVGDKIIFTLSDPDGGIDVSTPIVGEPPPMTWDIEELPLMGPWRSVAAGNASSKTYEYRADEDQTGFKIRAAVTYIDRRGSGKRAESEATAAVSRDPIVNAPPRFTGNRGQSIQETAAGENVGAPLTATDRDEGDSLTFGLIDSAAASYFEIVPNSGQLRTVEALDFETIFASSGGRLIFNVTLHDGEDVLGNDESDPVIDATATITITVLDVEEEGILTLTTDEPQVGQTVRTTLEDGDGSISGETWQWSRSVNGRSNWDPIGSATSSSYTVTQGDTNFFLRARVSYTDNRSGGKSAEAATANRVFGENQRPTFPSTENGQRSIPENSRSGVSVGDPVAAVDPEDDGLTYSLRGTDAAAFTIVSSSGQLRTSEALNFEATETYRFSIDVHDGLDGAGNPSTTVDDSQDVVVTIENVEEPGTVTLVTDTPSIQARVEVTAELNDDDGPVSTSWKWSRSPNGRTDWANIFEAGNQTYTPTLEADAGNYIRATAEYTDGFGSSTKTANAVSPRVGDPPPVNSPPVFPDAETGRREVAENVSGGDPVGDPVAATDLNAGNNTVNDPLAYSLIGTDAASFTIDASSGQIRLASGVELDYEGKRSYRVTVQVTDGRDQNGDDDNDAIDDTISVTIAVTNVNEAPVVSGDATIMFQENSDRAIATYSAADPERDTLTWSVSGSDFWISDRGQLYFASPPNYEGGRSSFSPTVTASDGDMEGTFTVTVTVTDVEEAGMVSITPLRGWEHTRFRADATDDDGVTGGLSWQWARSSNRSSWTDIASGQVYSATADDVGNYLRASVSYSDKSASAVLPARIEELSAKPALNTAPEFAESTATLTIGQGTAAGRPIGAALRATDPDPDDILTYSLSGTHADDFEIDRASGQLRTKAVLDPLVEDTYTVTVSVHDGFDASYDPSQFVDDSVAVTITVTAVSTPIIGVGGGGGGGPSGPTPSDIEFEWNVTRDIEELDSGNDTPAGAWSDGTTLWLLDNASGAGDAVYAYDLESGERVEEREFELDETNRAPRGIWSDGETVWVSDSGQDRLFAYDLASGERLPDSDIALTGRNADPRGIWSDGANLWVLDGGKNALFAYDLPSGELLTEYSLDPSNNDPRGLWSDGVSVWVSDDVAKRLFAYRLPAPSQEERAADEEPPALERVGDENFTELSSSSNNSPRGIWSDGDVMYVADESDDRVYTYNMPDAIDARLASLTLSGVDIGEFDSARAEYAGTAGDDVTETTVGAQTSQSGATVLIKPDDADGDSENGHQIALEGVSEITVTVTSRDESRERVYRVLVGDPGQDAPCFRGAVALGFSLVVYAGGSVEELVTCAQSRHGTALYTLHDGGYVPYILGAPEFVNSSFGELFAGGVPATTPLIIKSDGPPTPAPAGSITGDDLTPPWPECLRGTVATGFSLVLYRGGAIEELVTCAESRNITAIYALDEGGYVAYILGAPEFVNRSFGALFAGGVPAAAPLIVKSDGVSAAGATAAAP